MSQIINPERRDPGYLKNKADVGLSRVDNYSLSEIQDIVHGALREEYASGEIYRVDELKAGKSVEIPLIQFVSNGDSKASIFIGLVDSNYNVLYYCKAHIRHSNKTTTYYDGDSKFNVSFELSPTRPSSDVMSLRYYSSTTFPVVSLYLKEGLGENSIKGVLINQIPELIVEDRSYKNSVKFLNPEENIETFIDEGLNPDSTVFVFKSERTVSSEAKSLSIYKNGEQYFPAVNERLDLESLDFPTINNIPFTGDKGSGYSSIDGNYNTRKITIAAKHTLKDESVGLEKAGAHKWEVLTEIPEVSYLGTSASTETKSRWESSSNTGLCRLVGLPEKSGDVDDFWASVRSLQDLVNVDKERNENVVSYGFLKEYTNRLVKVFGILINNSGVAIKTVLLYEYVPDLEVNKATYDGKTPISELNYLPNKKDIIDYVLVYPCAETTTLQVKNLDQFISIKKYTDEDFENEFSFRSHDNDLHSYVHFQIKSVEDFHWVNEHPAKGTLKISSIDSKNGKTIEELDTISVIFPKLDDSCLFKRNALGGVPTAIAFSENIYYSLQTKSWDWKTKSEDQNIFIKQEISDDKEYPIFKVFYPHPDDFDYDGNGVKLYGYTFLKELSKHTGDKIDENFKLPEADTEKNIKFTEFTQPKLEEEKNFSSNEVFQFPVTFKKTDTSTNIWNKQEFLDSDYFYNSDNKSVLRLDSYYREPLPYFKFKGGTRVRTTWESKGFDWRINLSDCSLSNIEKDNLPSSTSFKVNFSLEKSSGTSVVAPSILEFPEIEQIPNSIPASFISNEEVETVARFDDKGKLSFTSNNKKITYLEGSGIIDEYVLYSESNDPLWAKYPYPLPLKTKKEGLRFLNDRNSYLPVGDISLSLFSNTLFHYWSEYRGSNPTTGENYEETAKEKIDAVIDNVNRKILLYVYTCHDSKSIYSDFNDSISSGTLPSFYEGPGNKVGEEWINTGTLVGGSLSIKRTINTDFVDSYSKNLDIKGDGATSISDGQDNDLITIVINGGVNINKSINNNIKTLFTNAGFPSIYGYNKKSITFKLYSNDTDKTPIYYDWEDKFITYDIYIGYGTSDYIPKKETVVDVNGNKRPFVGDVDQPETL